MIYRIFPSKHSAFTSFSVVDCSSMFKENKKGLSTPPFVTSNGSETQCPHLTIIFWLLYQKCKNLTTLRLIPFLSAYEKVANDLHNQMPLKHQKKHTKNGLPLSLYSDTSCFNVNTLMSDEALGLKPHWFSLVCKAASRHVTITCSNNLDITVAMAMGL